MKAGPKAQPTSSSLPRLRARTPSARFAEFCRRFLRHQQGPLAGKPVMLADWQMEIIRPLLDTVDELGLRRYRTAFITVARRNGKTVLAACLALYELYYGETGGEIIGAAGDRQQAHLAFDVASKMVEAASELASATLIYRRQLVVPFRGSTYRVVSSDAPRKHGINASFILIDELHAHRDRRLYDALATGTGSRAQPLVVVISTATDDPHFGHGRTVRLRGEGPRRRPARRRLSCRSSSRPRSMRICGTRPPGAWRTRLSGHSAPSPSSGSPPARRRRSRAASHHSERST